MSAAPQAKIRRLFELKSGERGEFFALLTERNRAQTAKGNPFFACRFRDARRRAAFMVWADSLFFDACANHWQPGQFFRIEALFSDHERFGPQIDIKKIDLVGPKDEADGFREEDFIEGLQFDAGTNLAALRALVETTIADEPLKRLTLELLDRYADVLKRLPASERRFYPYEGGWLAHVLHVTQNVVWLCDRYRERFAELQPPLNRDLVVAGAVLHDIGRAVELKPGESFVDAAEPTVPGRLLGHLFLGRDLVRDAAREQGDVNPELLLLLEHVIVAHLNHPEWGSPRLPLIPEAIILHHADDLDAKMEMYARCLTNDPSPGPFTEREPTLNRQLLKQRTL